VSADPHSVSPQVSDQVARYPLLRALLRRRSRRFGRGFALDGAPLGYTSAAPPSPLSRAEEAALAFAACGLTGYACADLPYGRAADGRAGHGEIMIHLVGRTVPSGDAAHGVAVFVLNDAGAWMLRRPQDFPRAAIPALVAAAHEGRLVELYEQSRVRIADARPAVPRSLPHTMPFNLWSANRPGVTTFVPVNELTALSINALLIAFEKDVGYFLLDDRNGYRPAGIAAFARSRGGHLHDNPAAGRVATIGIAESWVYEFLAVEQGAILQNLALMAEALGLGGFPYFAAHPSGWAEALGFRVDPVPFSRTIGAGPVVRLLLRAMRRDIPVPTPVGLERAGEALLRPFCPPYYRSMEEAVLAFLDYKYAPARGTLRDPAATPWRDGAAVQAGIARPSDQAVAATIAYCSYAYERYGRFPPGNGPFRTVLAYQAHRLDPAFYAAHYREEPSPSQGEPADEPA
jgi:hypothetical protein